MQALDNGAKFNSEQLHLKELGLSTLTACFVNANRDPKAAPVKTSDFYFFAPEEDESLKISSSACDTFFSLSRDRLLPGWLIGIAPLDKLKTGKSQPPLPVRKPRSWISDDLILIMPKVANDGRITAALAFNNGVHGNVTMSDPDSGRTFEVFVPEYAGVLSWTIDAEFNLVVK